MNIIKDVLETEGLGSKSCTSQEDSFLNPLTASRMGYKVWQILCTD